jgi:hypothetical protein
MDEITLPVLQDIISLLRPKVDLSDPKDNLLLHQIFMRISSLYCQLTFNKNQDKSSSDAVTDIVKTSHYAASSPIVSKD